ncbi:MAG: D-inositol-3-phosphate glycosyltransferase [Anaerolineae bacterium]|nr:D-inositol-3-phosphate glycosyltransferase [Anaerolineae bacterium]
MQIAYFTNTYYPVVSGVVQCVDTYRRTLGQQGHNVFVFAQNAGNHVEKEPFVFRYPAVTLPAYPNFPIAIPVSPKIDWLLPSLKLDVIHSHHPFLLGVTAASKAARLNVPLVFTYLTRYPEYSHYVPYNQKLVKIAIREYLANYMQKCHHIVVPSDSIKEELANTYGITRQITTIPIGFDGSMWAAVDGQAVRRAQGWGNETVLISVGRLAREKNWPTLLKAVAPILKSRPDTRFVLIGDGAERASLEKLAQELGIAARVNFTGMLSHSQVIGHLKAANLFCFASITETQGLVTLEAMAAGLPVVAVNATGTRDTVTHECEGLLTENEDSALTRAICRVLDSPTLWDRLAAAALKRAQCFSAEAQAGKLVSIYHQARADQRAGRCVQVAQPKTKHRTYSFPLSTTQ